jgi:hypothetical protein
MSKYELERARSMTIGELLETLDQGPSEHSWKVANEMLPPILEAAAGYYDDFDGFGGTPYTDWGLSDDALRLALFAIQRLAGSIDKDVAAREIVDLMSFLAMILSKDSPSDLWARLEVIRDTNPDLADPPTPTT